MNVSPGEVHRLFNEGLSITEIARRLHISRASVNHKLREFDLDKREADLDAREANIEAKEREAKEIRELGEKADSLENKVKALTSKVITLTKESNELEEAIRTNEVVLEEVKEFKRRSEENKNQMSEMEKEIAKRKAELSKITDILKKSEQKLSDTKMQLETGKKALDQIREDAYKKKIESERFAEEIMNLDKEYMMKKEAINEIEQSYYGFIELTKQIALFMPGVAEEKTRIHEGLRKKVIKGMEIIGKKAKITKPNFEFDF